MIARIHQVEDGYIAAYDRHFNYPVEEVWAMLTENAKLQQWFSELRIDDLREGGLILFDMQDGTYEKMKILELKAEAVLEFTWAEDIVRFELYPESEGCHLIFKEKIHTITDHTPRDLAGWHVCLDVIQGLLDEKPVENRKSEWAQWYPQYVEAIDAVRNC